MQWAVDNDSDIVRQTPRYDFSKRCPVDQGQPRLQRGQTASLETLIQLVSRKIAHSNRPHITFCPEFQQGFP